jgi:hypothetical protein
MKRRLTYFFTRSDEQDVSRALRESFPGLKFIDGQRWRTAAPPIADGIDLCKSSLVYLWPSDAVPELPSLQRSPSEYQGPSSGPVMQFMRCAERDGRLELGQLSAFIETAESSVGKTHGRVISFLKKRYACPLDCYSSRTGELLQVSVRGHLVGPSLRTSPPKGPRLVMAFDREEHFVPSREDA